MDHVRIISKLKYFTAKVNPNPILIIIIEKI